jgi:putative ABC transport system permease protein
LPGANKIFDYQHISFDPLNNVGLITFLFILIIVIAILSGLYPALKISGVSTIKIFKNKQNVKGNKGLTRTLTVLQLGFSLVTIAASIITAQNAKYLSSLNVGYNKDDIMVLQTDNASSFQFLENAARKHPDVFNVAGSQDQVGRTANQSSLLKYENAQLNSDVINVTPEYINLLKLDIVEGRNFLPNSQHDIDNSVIVNQKLVALMNWSNPVGKKIQSDGKTYEVTGVVKDFNYENFFSKIGPCVLKMNAENYNRVLSINIKNENITDLQNYLHTEWKKVMPDKPFETTFQTDVYNISYRESARTRELLFSIAMLTMIISSMGLFAQVALNIVKRTKEIGMRKILGARFFQIAGLMTKELFVLMAIAAIIFLPLVFIAVKNLFDVAYPYHIPLNAEFLVLALIVMITVMILATGTLLYKAAIANPVESLRTE